MSKHYRLWIEIEEWDSETDESQDVTKSGEAAPVPLGTFDSLKDAIDAADRHDVLQDRLKDVVVAGQYFYITIADKGQVVIKNEEEGIVVDIYPLEEGVGVPVAGTWAHDNELKGESE